MRSALVYCLDVDLAICVLVPVGLLFHDVKWGIGGKAARGFPEQQCLAAEARRGGFVESLCCYAEDGHGPQLPVGGGPVGGVACVVVHVVLSPDVGQLQGGPPGDRREGGFA